MKTENNTFIHKLITSLILLDLVLTSLAIPGQVKASGAVVLMVDTTSDNPALTACTIAPGDCSLRGAISHVNADTSVSAPMYEILLGAFTYTLTQTGASEENLNATGDLDTIPQNWLYITGVSSSSTRIDGNDIDRVIDHHGPSQLILTNLTIQNGQVATGLNGGGGIRNIDGALLWLNGVTVDSNVVLGTNGSQDLGGGIHNVDGTLDLEHSVISNNYALAGGGLSLGNTSLWMEESLVAANHATGSTGGGIDTANGGSFTILRSILIGNNAQQGGGFYNNGLGDLAMIDTSVIGNTTTDYGGGGMILFGTAALLRVTLSENSVTPGSNGGGLYVGGTVTVTNATITDNAAYRGAGLFIEKSGTVSFNHVTDANNTIYSGGEGSAVYMDDGGTGTGGTFSFVNSIFSSYDPDLTTCNKSPSATFTLNDYGYNLFDQTLNCYTHVFTDLTYAYPALGTLAFNGGWTPTLSLYPSSDAIDSASSADPQTDQRSHSRKDGDHDGFVSPDIGAFEYESDILFLPVILK